MSGNPKVLTGLMERRALAVAFDELAQTTDPEQLVQRAGEIAQHGSAAVPVLVSMLDTSDPQLRGGLGQVAIRLERSMIVPALRGVAMGRDSSDSARLSALTILDRYLHEPIDDALLAELQDADAVAHESLRELLHEMAENPYTILEYLGQLAEQPPDVPHIILDAIPAANPSPHLITLLRMLAQDLDPSLAQKAVERLGHNRSGQAIRALASLRWALAPELSALAERNLRKLRMRGVIESEADPEIEPWCAPPVTERVLLSAVDAAGAQLAWFIGPEDAGQCRILSIVTLDGSGIVACAEMRNVEAAELPARRGIGFVHHISHREQAEPVELLEGPISAGIQTLREGAAQNWASGAPTPLAYRLLNPLFWPDEAVGLDAAFPEEMLQDAGDAAAIAGLLDHPAFRRWRWWPADLPADEMDRPATALRAAFSRFDTEVSASYVRRLRAMSRWLTLARDEETAALASAAATQLRALPASESSFAQRLVSAGFGLAQLRHR